MVTPLRIYLVSLEHVHTDAKEFHKSIPNVLIKFKENIFFVEGAETKYGIIFKSFLLV